MLQVQKSLALAILFTQSAQACFCSHATQNPTHHRRDIQTGTLGSLAIQNVRVFDGYKVGPPQTVIIDGDVIGAPGTAVNSTYDAKGRILIPGLMDGHAHPPDVYSLQNLTSYGVTTVFNMACANYTACQQMKNQPGLTSFITAGNPTQGPGSCHATGQHTPANRLFYGPEQAPSAVAYAFNNGSDFFKITAEVNGPSTESQIELVRNVHSFGRQSMTHASSLYAYDQVGPSRTDGIQHVPLDGLISSSTIALIKSQNQTVTPTIYIAQAALENPVLLTVIGCGVTNSNNLTAWQKSVDFATENAKMLYQAGVTLITGTDSVGQTANFSVPIGSSLHQELQTFVKIGMSPAEALRAATIVPARFHRLNDRGVIAPGKRADMLLLNSDPTVNITNTLDIEKVWVGGMEYPDVQKLPK